MYFYVVEKIVGKMCIRCFYNIYILYFILWLENNEDINGIKDYIEGS